MVKQNKSLNIAGSQHSGFPRNLTHTNLVIPSVSQFSWGSQSIIDIKQKGIKLHDAVLAFNINAITGVTPNGSTLPVLNSCYSWFQKIEILINGSVMDTIYPDFNAYILNNLYAPDEDRLLLNIAAGGSIANRYTLSNTNGSVWYLSLKTLFNQNHFGILTQNHEVQLRVTMNPLSNVLNQGALVGTCACTINNVSLLARVTQLDTPTIQRLLVDMNKTPRHSLFLSTRYQSFVVQAGVSNTNLVMTAITGSVHSLYFIVRNTNALTGASNNSYNIIKDFSINGSDGQNIVGGTVIPSTFNLLIQNKHWFESTFCSEGFTGVNNSYVYTYSFSVDPASSFKNASHLTTRIMTGNENLIINFTSALASTAQVDVFALVESSLEQSPSYVKLINL